MATTCAYFDDINFGVFDVSMYDCFSVSDIPTLVNITTSSKKNTSTTSINNVTNISKSL